MTVRVPRGRVMEIDVQKGRYRASLRPAAAAGEALARAQALRHACFIAAAGLPPRAGGLDRDAFDARCSHLFVEEAATGALVATCRLLPLTRAELAGAYAAQFYDLSPLARLAGPYLEVGRFCIAPGQHDPDILRLAWAMIGGLVDGTGVGVMFGCSSFAGTDPARYQAALTLLAARHLGPEGLRPVARGNVARRLSPEAAPLADGLRAMPPLLRTYLAMGAWVGGEVVADHDLNTLHVFTAVETRLVPPARARSLRMILGQG